MANVDNPNGFTVVSPDTAGRKYYRKAGGGAIAVNDPVILDATNMELTSDGCRYADIATASSARLLGTALTAAPADAVNDVPFMVCDDPNAVFEGQCHDDPTDKTGMTAPACDIIGTTGAFEIDEDATVTEVVCILGIAPTPENTAGVNARVHFKITKHELQR